MKETDLIQLCRKGDESAFRMLMQTYQSYAFSLAFRLLCHEEDARDSVQESFIRVWKHIGNFKEDHQFKTWLYRIVTNVCLDRLRQRKKRQKDCLPLEEAGTQLVASGDIEKELRNAEMAAIIAELVGDLPPRQRAVFVLRDLEELDLAEIASVLGLSVSNVKSHLYYARKNIRKVLLRMESPE